MKQERNSAPASQRGLVVTNLKSCEVKVLPPKLPNVITATVAGRNSDWSGPEGFSTNLDPFRSLEL